MRGHIRVDRQQNLLGDRVAGMERHTGQRQCRLSGEEVMQHHRFRVLLTALAALSASADSAADAAALIHPLEWPQSGPLIALDAKTEQLVDQLVGRMSNEEKVGQL